MIIIGGDNNRVVIYSALKCCICRIHLSGKWHLKSCSMSRSRIDYPVAPDNRHSLNTSLFLFLVLSVFFSLSWVCNGIHVKMGTVEKVGSWGHPTANNPRCGHKYSFFQMWVIWKLENFPTTFAVTQLLRKSSHNNTVIEHRLECELVFFMCFSPPPRVN